MGIKRVSFIDCMRGFCLLGILLANLLIFQFGFIGKEEIKGLSQLDQGALYFLKVFVEGSFMPIFTLLFGFSLMKLVESVRRKGRKSRWIILRRSIGLIALGWLHSVIWEGDILTIYGLTIPALIFFINRKAKTTFIWAGILFLFIFPTVLLSESNEVSVKEQQEINTYIEKESQTFANGTFAEIRNFRANAEYPGIEVDEVDEVGEMMIFMIVSLLPLFLVGMGLAKIRAFENMDNEKKWYLLGVLLVPIGLFCKSLGLIENNLSLMFSTVGKTLLSLGYVCLAALLYKVWHDSIISKVFECVGKLSLTNYLVQSIICTTVFYGYGLGLFGKLGVFNGILFGLIIYSLQCIISFFYLKKNKRGPFEQNLHMWTHWSYPDHIKQKEQVQ
ncbi:membrane protein [Lysinibacillus sphaericus]|uniref:DUF418 domain-containing protein n=2 Tax=Lysinibacillus sphaericus TaxID=1421 RepID=UPI0018CF2C2C|nr:DUF418 domain-containing protein [Lysinibacillus sphaericus]MBG9454779.1 membrane protein [Lysinibacillus sphaericus]MBG9478207.1 membrane protein [Lysinibacillus sphaericus]MBG9590920.1 membrane protein [Lysinibacillus sphaericus]